MVGTKSSTYFTEFCKNYHFSKNVYKGIGYFIKIEQFTERERRGNYQQVFSKPLNNAEDNKCVEFYF